MTKTAFITGISGMVGSHLAEYLFKNTDWNIVGLIRWRSPLGNLVNLTSPINSEERVSLEYGDLRDSISIDKAVDKVRPDYIFHLAAQSFPKTSFDSPLDTYETNIQGTTRILEAAKKFSPNAMIHVCSSSEVYGRVPKEKIPIDENCSFHPASPYAISKVGTDLVGRYYAEAFGMNVMVTRMFTHTGPRRGDVFAESTFAKQIAMIEAGIQSPILKVGNLHSLRTIADVRDAVRAYYLLLTKTPVPGAAYNIGGSYSTTIGEILKYLLSKTKIKNIEIVEDPKRLRPIDADLQIPNSNKFKLHTGWEPKYKFEQTMDDLLEYWRAEVDRNPSGFLIR